MGGLLMMTYWNEDIRVAWIRSSLLQAQSSNIACLLKRWIQFGPLLIHGLGAGSLLVVLRMKAFQKAAFSILPERKKIDGRVIHVEPPFMSNPDFNWKGFLKRLIIAITLLFVLGPVVLGILFGIGVFFMMLRLIFPRKGKTGPGFLSGIANNFIGFFLLSKLHGSKADMPVRDIRLRTTSGQEYLIRLKGDLISGNVNVGDEIEVDGYDHRGTIIMKRGKNKRTGAEIRVKRR